MNSLGSKLKNHQGGALRNPKISRITKQIQQLLAFEQGSTYLTGSEKENHCLNFNHSIREEPSQQNTIERSLKRNSSLRTQHFSDLQLYKSKVLMLEEELGNYMKENKHLKENNKELLQSNILLKTQNEKLNYSRTTMKVKSDDDLLQSDEEQIQEEQDLPNLINLHDQNSKLLTRILELTLSKGESMEQYSQTQSPEKYFHQTQTDNGLLTALQSFCKQENIDTLEPKENFSNWINNFISLQITKREEPLKCQIQLFKQIINKNKKQYQEKEKRFSRLLQDSQKTIINLMEEMRKFQGQSKLNYSRYLSASRGVRGKSQNH